MQFETVCLENDLIPNLGIAVKVSNQQVAIFYMPNTKERVFALSNWDPISKANVLSRGILGDIQGRLVVSSPIHKHHFDLKTGQCLEEEVSVPSYSVKIENGKISLAVETLYEQTA
ncbi:nitrite reductase small subunit NirD [Reinekea marina]|uniref:Nitrite reductase small subunit NirD n=1 Tax=Reinekea marina TaxID=1310421 RepID=A0ABV7WXG0_9GAMM|nr:nitrite reductase small subunit NirD [Reinekea marina]MDN3649646.1 nitrite reductase small subunit NirD [Reinekea marina]